MPIDINNIEEFRGLEQQLALIEADIGAFAGEPFPEHPGLRATEVEVRAWVSAHDNRSERLANLMRERGDLLRRLRLLSG